MFWRYLSIKEWRIVFEREKFGKFNKLTLLLVSLTI
jgi:hypothetical protein